MKYLALSLLSLFSFGCEFSQEQHNSGASGNNDMQLDEECEGTLGAGGAATSISVGRIGGGCFYVDETEVSVAALNDAAAQLEAHIPEGCDASSFSVLPLPGPDDHPATGLDWCVATAYCEAVDRRLCGAYEGNGQDLNELETTCTDGDNAEFAFREELDSESCNLDGDMLSAIDENSDCVTPSGILALVGNAREWTAECSDDGCKVRGGSFRDSAASSCTTQTTVSRETTAADLGFRCCAD